METYIIHINISTSVGVEPTNVACAPSYCYLDVVFIMLINIKTFIIVGIFNIYEQDKFRAQLS